MPIWRVERSGISSNAVSVQITSAASTVSSERGAIGAGAAWPSKRVTRSNFEMWTRFWPPVRMKSGWISPTRCFDVAISVGAKKTELPKEQ
jgi:hypothetical protein